MTWLEPMWLAYPTAALALATLVAAGSVRWWLRVNPMLPTSHRMDEMAWRPRDFRGATNLHQVFPAAFAVSAVAYVPAASAVYYPDVPAGYRAP